MQLVREIARHKFRMAQPVEKKGELQFKMGFRMHLPGAAYPIEPFINSELVSVVEKFWVAFDRNLDKPKSPTWPTNSLSRRILPGFRSQ